MLWGMVLDGGWGAGGRPEEEGEAARPPWEWSCGGRRGQR